MGGESCREPCSNRINEEGGTGHSKCRNFAFVGEERVQGGKAGLTGEDTDRSEKKAICDPSKNPIPKDCDFAEDGGVGHQEVSTIC